MNKHIWMVLFVMAALGLAGCGQRPRTIVLEQAERFFELLRNNQMAEAYAMLASASREEAGVEAFQQAVEALGFVGNRGVAWDPPYIDDDYGSIEGVVTARDGVLVPQELVFFREGRQWVLHIVRPTRAFLEAETRAAERGRMPDPDALETLVMDTLVGLAEALVSGDYSAFHRSMAETWRENTTPDYLREAWEWAASPEVGFDWTSIRGKSPEFDPPPELMADGLLKLKGHVPAGDKRLEFELIYSHGAQVWRLDSISFRPPL